MEKLVLEKEAAKVLNSFRLNQYPLTALGTAYSDDISSLLGMSSGDEKLMLRYLGGDEQVELEEKPWKFGLAVGSVVTLPDGKEVVVSEDVVIYGEEHKD